MSQVRVYLLDIQEDRFAFIRAVIIEERRKERQTAFLVAQRALASLPLRRTEDTLSWTGPDPEDDERGRKGTPHRRFGGMTKQDRIKEHMDGVDNREGEGGK